MPIYNNADKSPTIAIFLKATYHVATVSLNCSTIDFSLPPSSWLWSPSVLKKLASRADTFPAKISAGVSFIFGIPYFPVAVSIYSSAISTCGTPDTGLFSFNTCIIFECSNTPEFKKTSDLSPIILRCNR